MFRFATLKLYFQITEVQSWHWVIFCLQLLNCFLVLDVAFYFILLLDRGLLLLISTEIGAGYHGLLHSVLERSQIDRFQIFWPVWCSQLIKGRWFYMFGHGWDSLRLDYTSIVVWDLDQTWQLFLNWLWGSLWRFWWSRTELLFKSIDQARLYEFQMWFTQLLYNALMFWYVVLLRDQFFMLIEDWYKFSVLNRQLQQWSILDTIC